MVLTKSRLIFQDNMANLYEIPFEDQDKERFFLEELTDLDKIAFYNQEYDLNSPRDVEKVPENFYLVKKVHEETVWKLDCEGKLELTEFEESQISLERLESQFVEPYSKTLRKFICID